MGVDALIINRNNMNYTLKPSMEDCLNLIDNDYSLLTAKSCKTPNLLKWQELKDEPLSKLDFKNTYDRSNSDIIGLVCGYKGLECIDVDLKIFWIDKTKQPEAQEMQEMADFWDEYLSFLKDNIEDFDTKFVIYRTMNFGYHILYRSNLCEGNQKIAKLKDYQGEVIETRGIGGYCAVYPDGNVTDKTYEDVDYISDDDRNILFSISRTYNYVEPIDVVLPTKAKQEFNGSDLPCWTDYNNKTNVIDLIASDFKVVRDLKDKTIIKRIGADSEHSGYVYKDTGLMYLFSTGTSFEAEKAYNPFTVYAHLNHNDDLSSAAKQLYSEGYGDRIQRAEMTIVEDDVIEAEDEILPFPIDVFPVFIQNMMKKYESTLGYNLDFMSIGLMFTAGTIAGNKYKVKVKNGYVGAPLFWLVALGNPGTKKTHPIRAMLNPLKLIDDNHREQYLKQSTDFERMTAEEKKAGNLAEPLLTQTIVKDATLEALHHVHSTNRKGLGLYKDELNGFFGDMNKYRQGSDAEFWLESYNNGSHTSNRVSRKVQHIDEIFINIIGTMQPDVFKDILSQKQNGTVDRFLFTQASTDVIDETLEEMPQDLIDKYNAELLQFNKNLVYQSKADAVILPFNRECQLLWLDYSNSLNPTVRSEDETQQIQNYISKIKTYVPRFALVLTLINHIFDKKPLEVTEDVMLDSFKMADYFISSARIVFKSAQETTNIKEEGKYIRGRSREEQIVILYKSGHKQIRIAKQIGCSSAYVSKVLAKHKKS